MDLYPKSQARPRNIWLRNEELLLSVERLAQISFQLSDSRGDLKDRNCSDTPIRTHASMSVDSLIVPCIPHPARIQVVGVQLPESRIPCVNLIRSSAPSGCMLPVATPLPMPRTGTWSLGLASFFDLSLPEQRFPIFFLK